MQKLSTVWFLLIGMLCGFGYAQETQNILKIKTVDGISFNEMYLNTQLTDKLYLQTGLRTSYLEGNYYKFDMPLHMGYKLNDKTTVFLGPKFSYLNSFTYPYPGLSYQNTNLSVQVGFRYYFTQQFYSEVWYEYRLFNPYKNNEVNIGVLSSGSFFRFGLGYQF